MTTVTSTIADDFSEGFRSISAGLRLRYNLIDGHLLTSPSHTVLFMTSIDGSSVFSIVYDAMRKQAQALGAGGYVKSFYDSGDPHDYLTEITARSLTTGSSWCVPARATDDAQWHAFIHYCVVRDGVRMRTGYAIIMRNEALWGTFDVAAKGFFRGQLALFAEDRKIPSIDCESLGFAALHTSHATDRRPVLRADHGATDTQPGSVLDLETATAALVQEVNALVPVIEDGESQRRWRELTHTIGERTETQIVTALESCLDRLRELRASTAQQNNFAIPSCAAARSPSTDRDGQTPSERLPQRVVALIGALFSTAMTSRPMTTLSAEKFHALYVPEHGVFLPWPQCLDGLLHPSDQVVAGTAEVVTEIVLLINAQLTSVRVAGFPYGPGRKQHRGFFLPAEWTVKTSCQIGSHAVVIAAGHLEQVPAL
jgi:hypothetical protein